MLLSILKIGSQNCVAADRFRNRQRNRVAADTEIGSDGGVINSIYIYIYIFFWVFTVKVRGNRDKEVQRAASVVCREAERGLVAGCCGEGDGDGCWFGKDNRGNDEGRELMSGGSGRRKSKERGNDGWKEKKGLGF